MRQAVPPRPLAIHISDLLRCHSLSPHVPKTLPAHTMASAVRGNAVTHRAGKAISRQTDLLRAVKHRTNKGRRTRLLIDEDHIALHACMSEGVGLCTIVGIDGSFSRRRGAQLAVFRDKSIAGNLADGCLENQLASDCLAATAPVVKRYGKGSDNIDFRLPCGGGLDILIDPAPDHMACRTVFAQLQERKAAHLHLPKNAFLAKRSYIPSLKIRAFGEGPELAALQKLGEAAGIATEIIGKSDLSLGRSSAYPRADHWTAVVLLFHDHQWEISLLEEAMASDAFYIGAQGGRQARESRLTELSARGAKAKDLARITSPIGMPHHSRTPQALALACLAEIMGMYEKLRPQNG